MTHLRKLGISALAMLTLTACSASENSGGVKGTLEGEGYTVTVIGANEYNQGKGRITGEGLSEYVSALKANTAGDGIDTMMIWFFVNTYQAENFLRDHTTSLANLLTSLKNGNFGLRNNAVWCGNKSAATVLGWTV